MKIRIVVSNLRRGMMRHITRNLNVGIEDTVGLWQTTRRTLR